MSQNQPPDPIQQVIENVNTAAKISENGVIEIAIPDSPQVFKGTPQELLDQFVKAQTNATQTIKSERQEKEQLRQELANMRAQQVQPPPPPGAKNNDEYFKTWAENPNQALKRQLAEEFGLPEDKVIPMLKRGLETSVVNAAAEEFISRCQDFPQSPQSAELMRNKVAQRFGVTADAANADNLELAYHELVREGKLVPNQIPTSGLMNQNQPLPNLRGGSVPASPVTDVMAQFGKMTADQMKEAIEKMAAMGHR